MVFHFSLAVYWTMLSFFVKLGTTIIFTELRDLFDKIRQKRNPASHPTSYRVTESDREEVKGWCEKIISKKHGIFEEVYGVMEPVMVSAINTSRICDQIVLDWIHNNYVIQSNGPSQCSCENVVVCIEPSSPSSVCHSLQKYFSICFTTV